MQLNTDKANKTDSQRPNPSSPKVRAPWKGPGIVQARCDPVLYEILTKGSHAPWSAEAKWCSSCMGQAHSQTVPGPSHSTLEHSLHIWTTLVTVDWKYFGWILQGSKGEEASGSTVPTPGGGTYPTISQRPRTKKTLYGFDIRTAEMSDCGSRQEAPHI